MIDRAFLIGSGASLRNGQWDTPIPNLPIWKALQSEFTIGINWLFKYYIPTVLLYGDYTFYWAEKENLAKLPLVFGMQDSFYTRTKLSKNIDLETFYLHDDIYLLPNSKRKEYHGKEAWSCGFYSRTLSGCLAINLAISLGYKEIFLLGFDACAVDGRTHFYQDEMIPCGETEHGDKQDTGVGMTDGKYNTSVYNSDVNEKFLPFLKEKDVKIFNVSPESKITLFEKMSYKELNESLQQIVHPVSQDYLRYKIKEQYYAQYNN